MISVLKFLGGQRQPIGGENSPVKNTKAGDAPESNDANLFRKKRFHRGDNLNFLPNRADYFSPTFLQDYLLKGWIPAEPILNRNTRITAFGSCFAANITQHLKKIGFNLASNRERNIHISRIADGLVNTAAILGQFEWALENKEQAADLWHGWDAEAYGCDESIRLRTRDIFLATEFFVITLGLSEVWYDEKTGGTFWRAVPEEAFDASRHKFRVLSVEETKADIASIYRLIRTHIPQAKILFTISPIPLSATFRPVSCLTANRVSKAILSAALDEFLRSERAELGASLFYFPSMDIVQSAFVDPWTEDVRHPARHVLQTVMKTFEASFCIGGCTLEEANRLLQESRAYNLRLVARRVRETAEGARRKIDAMTANKAARLAGRASGITPDMLQPAKK